LQKVEKLFSSGVRKSPRGAFLYESRKEKRMTNDSNENKNKISLTERIRKITSAALARISHEFSGKKPRFLA